MGSQMRLSGLISGMDTDSIISQLVSVRRTKVTKQIGNQTKLSWKQDIWKDLNKDLKALQASAQKMRFSSSYTKKTVKASDPNKVSVLAADGTTDSVQSLKVDSLAKTAYLTGGVVSRADGSKGKITALSKLSDLGITGDTSITLTDNKGNAIGDPIQLKAEDSVSSFLTKLKDKGLNASFDETNQRFFISAKQSGADYDFNFSGDSSAISKLGLTVAQEGEEITDSKATKIKGEDAVIYLNGAKFKNSNNTFNINGLTITALGKTDANEEITLTTENDTSGIYDSIKSFLKTYNNIVNKLDKVYNAAVAKGYNPLTDEEKEALSEKEVEEYENKIKDSLLRGDSTVSSIINSLTSATSKGFEIGGKTMYLSNFGIGSLSYFTSADNEKHALHIDGDADDENTAGKADKLLSMIKNDPDTVVSFFTKLSNQLYNDMNKLSSSVNGMRSFGTFYEDKKMKSDYDSYTTKIADMEEKVNDYEDRLYKQYSAMEKAMAKLQSKTSALSGLFGTGN